MATSAFKSTQRILIIVLLSSALSIGVSRGQDTLQTSIYFDTDKYQLYEAHREILKSLFDSLSESTMIERVTALGYADLRGNGGYNQGLSERRVLSISSYLLERYPEDIPRIYSSGMGAVGSRDNLSAYRRVDIEVVHRSGVKTYTNAVEITDLSEIDPTTLKPGTYLNIKLLNFQPGRSRLLQSAIPQLKKLEKMLLTHTNIHIQIDGHICCRAEFDNREDGRDIDKNTDNLSTQRAKNIHDYLIRKGVDPKRLTYKGYGHSRPYVHPEVTEEDRIQNRRVEVLITKV